MAEHYLNLIDKVYFREMGKLKRENPDIIYSKDYKICDYISPLTENTFTTKFLFLKSSDTSIILSKKRNNSKCILYFDELKIIQTLIYLSNNYSHEFMHIINAFINLLKDESKDYVEFSILSKKITVLGIPYLDCENEFNTFADVEIKINDFICLLNLIIEKERISKRKFYGKSTICKYILFSSMFSDKENNIKKKEKRILKAIGIDYKKTLLGYKKIINENKEDKELIINPADIIRYL